MLILESDLPSGTALPGVAPLTSGQASTSHQTEEDVSQATPNITLKAPEITAHTRLLNGTAPLSLLTGVRKDVLLLWVRELGLDVEVKATKPVIADMLYRYVCLPECKLHSALRLTFQYAS